MAACKLPLLTHKIAGFFNLAGRPPLSWNGMLLYVKNLPILLFCY